MCWLNMSWWIIYMPSSFTDLVVPILLSCISNLCDTELSILLRAVAWYLSGLVIMWLLLNQSTAWSASFFKFRLKLLFEFLQVASNGTDTFSIFFLRNVDINLQSYKFTITLWIIVIHWCSRCKKCIHSKLLHSSSILYK